MSNYNTHLQSNNTDLQQVLQTLQNKAGGGEQATPVIEVNSSTGLITATAGIKSSTYQLAFQPSKTITPSTTNQIAVSSGYYTGGDITVAGDSNLVAGNIKSGVSIFGVNGTLEEGGESGEAIEWSENEDAIINGTILNYLNDRVTSIRAYAFYNCSKLTSVNFPECTSIGSSAFQSCSKLTSANFPKCTKINSCAFSVCSSLTTISFPVCTNISNSVFYLCSRLTSANFPKCTSIGSFAFLNCYNLNTISFPVCTNIGSKAFYNCSKLTSANFPKCTSIGSSAFTACFSLTTISFPVCTNISYGIFMGCSNLTTVSFPICTNIGYYAFNQCSKLTSVNFPECTSIESGAFMYCRILSSLTLGASIVCTLSNSNAFSSTPYAGYSSYFSGTPWIYVPASLIDAYKSATNWVYFSSYFSTIESLYDGSSN